MNKKDFIEFFKYDDAASLANLYEKAALSNKTGKCIFFNEFYPPVIWTRLIELENKLGVKIDTFGIFECADRRVIAFNRHYGEEVPITLAEIGINSKFENITHRDCLGSIMSFGIKREKFGDLVLNENKLYFPVVDEVFDYISERLTKIKHTPIKVKRADSYTETSKKNYEEKVIVVTSLRIDALVSSITGVSRSKAIDLIKQNFVKVNYMDVNEKDKYISMKDVVTIKKYGKFIFDEEVSKTNKERLRIKIKKFI